MAGDEVLSASEYRVRMGLSIPPRAEPKKRAQPERDLQTQAVAWIEAMGIPVFAVPNGGSRDVREAQQMKRSGVRPGVPDLVLVFPNGRTGWMELKSDEGRLSPPQQTWLMVLEDRDHWYACCRDLDTIQDTVREWTEKATEEGAR